MFLSSLQQPTGPSSSLWKEKSTKDSDKPVREWLGEVPSPGKLRRLSFLGELLGLQTEELSEIPYQLIHRSASAVIEAGRLAATPMVLIHSWGTNDEGFGDFARLVSLMHGEAEIGRAVSAHSQPARRSGSFGFVGMSAGDTTDEMR